VDELEAHRPRLLGLAYRMLSSWAEAEDAVQEAFLRHAALPEPSEVEDLAAWLTTVVSRVCLDVLRSARVRREAYVGPWLPEPLVARLPGAGPDPAEVAELGEQVSLALLVVLDRLPPEQRVAFVLHDAFDVPFEAIGDALGTSAANARQLASRGRRAVRASPVVEPSGDGAEQRRVLDAFLDAAGRGDLAGLARVLAPDVELVADGGGLAPAVRAPVVGAGQVGRFVAGLLRQAQHQPVGRVLAEPVLVNGEAGYVFEGNDVLLVMVPVVRDGRIVALYHLLNPHKLAAVPRPTQPLMTARTPPPSARAP
jgi:RNA polymerase sigma-70 factor (ECF subfamily)